MKDQFEIPYGRTKQILHVDRERIKAVIRPTEQECVRSDEAAIVRTALDNPIASPRLSDLVRGKRRILLITSDHTRPVPSRITMPLLLEEIRAGQPDAEITILIATGMHRPTTQEELISKFGADIAIREKIVVHNAYDESAMAFFGTLPSGGELWLNALLREADSPGDLPDPGIEPKSPALQALPSGPPGKSFNTHLGPSLGDILALRVGRENC